MDAEFLDSRNNPVVVRVSPNDDGTIEVFAHAPNQYGVDKHTAIYLDAEQAARFAAAVTARSRDATEGSTSDE